MTTVVGPSAAAARAWAESDPPSTVSTWAKVSVRIRHRVPTQASSSWTSGSPRQIGRSASSTRGGTSAYSGTRSTLEVAP